MSALRAYSGGTVRDLNPIPYSSAECGHLDIYLIIYIIAQSALKVNIGASIYAESA